MVRGAVKTGKAIAGAAKGAAGGPYGNAAGFIWGSRKTIGKIVIVRFLADAPDFVHLHAAGSYFRRAGECLFPG